MARVPTGGGKFIKGADVTKGDTCVIKSEADWVKGEYKGQETNQYLATVTYKDEDRTLKFTKLSRFNLLELGSDSTEWMGKTIELDTVNVMVDGKMYKSIVCTPVKDSVQKGIPAEDVEWES